ncbi:hypothetical protein MASR2M39_12020 [Ignavibacteriales bacterium]
MDDAKKVLFEVENLLGTGMMSQKIGIYNQKSGNTKFFGKVMQFVNKGTAPIELQN